MTTLCRQQVIDLLKTAIGKEDSSSCSTFASSTVPELTLQLNYSEVNFKEGTTALKDAKTCYKTNKVNVHPKILELLKLQQENKGKQGVCVQLQDLLLQKEH